MFNIDKEILKIRKEVKKNGFVIKEYNNNNLKVWKKLDKILSFSDDIKEIEGSMCNPNLRFIMYYACNDKFVDFLSVEVEIFKDIIKQLRKIIRKRLKKS